MSVKIANVNPDSLCGKKEISAGFILHSINGHHINDVFDYRFYADAKRLNMEFEAPDGAQVSLHIKSPGDIDKLGLVFDTYLMDKQHSCKNKCIFCFVDQMPHGMRDSLYFKDDDARLSFLFGNYVTLTNMTDEDIDRLITMHISPVNISVHTMNPDLRVRMMKNPNAGKVLSYINRLADAGIDINAQLVLCPGFNDGEELLYSLNELAKIGKAVVSVAAVPVGLTKHREGLCELTGYNKFSAGIVIDMIDNFNSEHYNEFGRNFCYAADEFYIKAERKIPDYKYYDDFRQIDNGVGMWRDCEALFSDALKQLNECTDSKVAIITGVAASPLMRELTDAFKAKFPLKIIDVFTVLNDFFGHSVTVAGLVTATDIIKQVKDLSGYDKALIPSVMLRSSDEKVFLDDISLDEVSEKLNVKIIPVTSSGSDLLHLIV